MGLAGPVLGTVAALVPLALYFAAGELLFQALAYVGFFLNLFNLIPLTPLDGGRALAAISPGAWVIGFLTLLGLMFMVGFTPLLLLAATAAGTQLTFIEELPS